MLVIRGVPASSAGNNVGNLGKHHELLGPT